MLQIKQASDLNFFTVETIYRPFNDPSFHGIPRALAHHNRPGGLSYIQ